MFLPAFTAPEISNMCLICENSAQFCLDDIQSSKLPAEGNPARKKRLTRLIQDYQVSILRSLLNLVTDS
jgi:hypothetical protein